MSSNRSTIPPDWTRRRSSTSDQKKPEKHPLNRFFTNGFVQGVAVFIALAVALSGKLDSKGTLVAVLAAGMIGAIGIYTHYSGTRRKKIVASFLILIYGCTLWAFYSYLTSKPSMGAQSTTNQQQNAKPEEKKANNEEQAGKKQEPNPKVPKNEVAKENKPTPKIHRHTQGDNSPNVGSITQGPGSIAQVGGQGNQATINNFGAGIPKLVKVSETGTANPDGSYTTECVLRIESDVAPGHLTFQINAQGLQEVTFFPNVAGATSIQLVNVLKSETLYRATVNGPSGDYLLSVKTSQKTPISLGATFN